jgi:hypothetical protein
MRLQSETSHGFDKYIQLASCMSGPGVTPLLASSLESAHRKLRSQFFTGTRLFVLKALPKGRKFDQHYFLEQVLSSFSRQKGSNRRKKPDLGFVVHMDNPMCHNARKISLELEHNKIERAPHPAYSPDISWHDFWLFGFPKEKLRSRSYR